MIGGGILVAIVGAVVWYYDNDIRDWVKKRYGHHIKKGEDAVKDVAVDIKNRVTPEDEEKP